MAWNYLDTTQLLGLMRHTEAPSNFWLSRYFGSRMNFDSEYIEFEKITGGRKLAPFVSPMQKGHVLADRGSSVTRFKPAYIKTKHSLDPNKTMKRRAGELVGGSSSPAERANAIMMQYMQDQRSIIERRWEWMAAQAIINGSITVGGTDDYPEASVDFQRDAGHTVAKTLGNYWNASADFDIRGDISTWVNTIRNAKFSGPVTDLIVPPTVYDVMIKNSGLKDLLDTNYRGASDNLNRSILDGSTAQVVGNLGGFLNVIVYQDWYEDNDGNAQKFLADNEVILTGPAVQGVQCFGAIMDSKANYQPVEIFSKMFEEEDPSATFLLSQSAPLMVPMNPNNTFKAQVLA
jgi:hypothetical protein